MDTNDSQPITSSEEPLTFLELEAQIDERDETIRLLNEALSQALDALTLEDRAA